MKMSNIDPIITVVVIFIIELSFVIVGIFALQVYREFNAEIKEILSGIIAFMKKRKQNKEKKENDKRED